MTLPTRQFVTTRTHEIFAIAYELANRLGHYELTAMHVTLAMLQEGLNPAAQILLYSRQVPQNALRRELETQLPPGGAPHPSGQDLSWSASDERMLSLAAVEAEELGKEYVGSEHLLLAFLRDPTTEPAIGLARHGVSFDNVQQDVVRIYDRTMVWPGPAL